MARTEIVRMGEQTGKQDIAISYDRGPYELTNPLPQSYDTYRTMRKNPTIALARALAVAPVVAGDWSIENDDEVDDERIRFIQDQIMPIREIVVEQALLGGLDFGWQGFEKVFKKDKGQIVLQKLKPLLHDITDIMVDGITGTFAGFRQHQKLLPLGNSLLISFRAEGSQWHGTSLLENIRLTYNEWVEANAGAARYDSKMAGTDFVVFYPDGKTPINGVHKDNAEIADEMISAKHSSCRMKIPLPGIQQYTPDEIEAILKAWWRIDVLSDDNPRQPGFRDRLDYLDKLFARGLQWPERSLLEGMFGTKAEAGAHQSLALTNQDLVHRHVTRHINWYVIDQLLALNFGEDARGTIRLVAAPLVDAKLEFLRNLYLELMRNVQGHMEESPTVDWDAVKDTLGIPKAEEVDSDEEGEIPQGDDEPGPDPNDPLAGALRSLYRIPHAS
jgi:hypothetical protein